MSSGLEKFIDQFNNGDWGEFSSAFGNDVSKFLSLVKRRGLLNRINLETIDYNDPELVNSVMLSLINDDPSYINEIIEYSLGDVQIRPDGYYLRLDSLNELSEFFKDNKYSREYNDRDVVEKALSEDWWEPFSDTVYDVYDDIIEELDENNMKLLAERVLEIIGNQEFSLDEYSSPYFEDISDDNGMFIITESNVMSIVEDEDSMNSLFKGDLYELRNELRWLGDEAYNQAYNDEVYEDVFNELSTLFIGRHDWVQSKKNEKIIHTPYIKIRDIRSDIINFLVEFKGSSTNLYSDILSYTSMVTHYMDSADEWLRISISDYADHTKVSQYINEFLPDRLYR